MLRTFAYKPQIVPNLVCLAQGIHELEEIQTLQRGLADENQTRASTDLRGLGSRIVQDPELRCCVLPRCSQNSVLSCFVH